LAVLLMVLEAALSVFTPRPEVRTLDWARDFATDEWGQPYDDHAFPHLGAPGGPLDALDCRQYLELWLQWGTRLGKSFSGQVGQMKFADTAPCPMMTVSADASLAKLLAGRTKKMISHCPRLRGQLTRSSKTQIELALCRIYVGWPRSDASLADRAVRFGHASEIDKWVHVKTAKEADPLQLFDERFKEFAVHKKLKECSPGLKHASRIERGRLAGTNAQLHVPCPKCKRYQVLGRENILYDRLNGRLDVEQARETARYRCPLCHYEVGDEHRGWMMRGGVWVPEGCACDDNKARAAAARARVRGRPVWKGFAADADWCKGKPLRDGRHYSSQLSSIYSLSLTWGDLAEQIVKGELFPETLRNTTNGWWAETWEFAKRSQTWETLGERLMAPFDVGRGQLPPGYRLLTAGIDKQDDHYALTVDAWAAGPGRTSHTVDYAEIDSEHELLDALAEEYETADGRRIKISLSLLDSGFRPKEVHELVERARKKGIAILPCRGSTKSLGPGVLYKKKRLGADTAKPGAPYVLVDTCSTQDWIDRQLHEIEPGTPGGISLFRAELAEHQEFLEQLLNEAPVQRTDNRKHIVESWNRIDENIPNDFRDTKRYAAVAMLLRTRGKEIRQPTSAPAAAASPPKKRRRPQPGRAPIHRPGGWLNMP
jgi:phage terminase large subunit GpA-like protein